MKKKILAIMMAITLGVITSSGVALAVDGDDLNNMVNSPAGQVPNGGTGQTPGGTDAAGETGGENTVTTDSCSADYTILGLVPWYNGLTNGSCEVDIENHGGIEGALGTIIGNVAYDLFHVVAYLAVGYIIYSGYLYITAMGEPGKIAKAHKGIQGAIIGMMVALLAASIVKFVMVDIFGHSADGTIYQGDANAIIVNIVSGVLGLAGIVAVCMIIYGGVTYMMSAGDAGKVKKGKTILTYSIVGLIVVLLSYAIVSFVLAQMGS